MPTIEQGSPIFYKIPDAYKQERLTSTVLHFISPVQRYAICRTVVLHFYDRTIAGSTGILRQARHFRERIQKSRAFRAPCRDTIDT